MYKITTTISSLLFLLCSCGTLINKSNLKLELDTENPINSVYSGNKFGDCIDINDEYIVVTGGAGAKNSEARKIYIFDMDYQLLNTLSDTKEYKISYDISLHNNLVLTQIRKNPNAKLLLYDILNNKKTIIYTPEEVSGNFEIHEIHLYGNYIFAGTPNDDDCNGLVYIFNLNGELIKKITPMYKRENFGSSIDYNGKNLIIGGYNSNHVYVYDESFNLIKIINENSEITTKGIGDSVSLFNNKIIYTVSGSFNYPSDSLLDLLIINPIKKVFKPNKASYAIIHDLENNTNLEITNSSFDPLWGITINTSDYSENIVINSNYRIYLFDSSGKLQQTIDPDFNRGKISVSHNSKILLTGSTKWSYNATLQLYNIIERAQ